MKKVAHILESKGSEVWAVSPEATVGEALAMMADKNCGALLVLDGDEVAGIISERDYARRVELAGKTAAETGVAEIMTTAVEYVDPEQTAEDCMALMTSSYFRHLPVISEGTLVGIVSIGDVVKAVMEEQGFVIEQLHRYITGGA